jgi:hypothetical protein
MAPLHGWAYLELPTAAAVQAYLNAVMVIVDLIARLCERNPHVPCEQVPTPTALVAGQVGVGVSQNDLRRQLRAALDERGPSDVVVQTANTLQGLEVEVVFVWHPLSGLAEADKLHLDPGRLCVLVTRHRQACVVVGRAGASELLDDRPPPPTVALLGYDPDRIPQRLGGAPSRVRRAS